MGFYDLSKTERRALVSDIQETIEEDLKTGGTTGIVKYASDEDGYVRKQAYLILGRLYRDRLEIRAQIMRTVKKLFEREDLYLKQTMVYTLGEIGKHASKEVAGLLGKALEDMRPKVRHAVVGALKQMGEKNPEPTLAFARKFLHHPNPEVRREIVHGIELRGRTHPEDVLPLLKDVQNDPDRTVRKTALHVLGQISYKEGCLEKVIPEILSWENEAFVAQTVTEILKTHEKYGRKFSARLYDEARKYIEQQQYEITKGE